MNTLLTLVIWNRIFDSGVGGGAVSTRRISNPLALAVLVSLAEKPDYPYDIALRLRARAKHRASS